MDQVQVVMHGVDETADALGRIGNRLGVGMAELVRKQSGLFAKDLMRLTPPTGRAGGLDGESFASQLRVGKKAITRDLVRVYTKASSVAATMREIGEPGRNAARGFMRHANRGETDEARGIMRNFGLAQPLSIGKLDRRQHRQARNSRGRVQDLGDRRHIITDPAALNRYRLELELQLMLLKAGWLPGALRFGAKGIHISITRHGTAVGRIVDLTQPGSHRPRDPSVILVNNVRYAQSSNTRVAFVNKATLHRQRQVQRQLEVLERRAVGSRRI